MDYVTMLPLGFSWHFHIWTKLQYNLSDFPGIVTYVLCYNVTCRIFKKLSYMDYVKMLPLGFSWHCHKWALLQCHHQDFLGILIELHQAAVAGHSSMLPRGFSWHCHGCTMLKCYLQDFLNIVIYGLCYNVTSRIFLTLYYMDCYNDTSRIFLALSWMERMWVIPLSDSCFASLESLMLPTQRPGRICQHRIGIQLDSQQSQL